MAGRDGKYRYVTDQRVREVYLTAGLDRFSAMFARSFLLSLGFEVVNINST